MCDSSTGPVEFLIGKRSGIKRLPFAEVNTDQGVYDTMQDANPKGWVTVLLKDGCEPICPKYAF
jgi:nicotinamidase-related amidase